MPSLHRPYYLYLRTKLAIQHSDEAIEALAACYDEYFVVWILSLAEDVQAWENGMALLFRERRSGDEMLDLLRPGLSHFDAWAFHDAHGYAVDSAGIGPASHFFASHDAAAQIFLEFRPGDRDPDATVAAIRNRFTTDACAPAFHFADGRILFAAGTEPANTIYRRCERQLSAVRNWAICDAAGDTYGPGGLNGSQWEGLVLSDLTFSD